MSYQPVAEAELAAVVTFLEMREPPATTTDSRSSSDGRLSLERIVRPDPEAYRSLFRLIGAPWLWFSRLVMDDAALGAIIRHPKVELFAVRDSADTPEGADVGMVELDYRAAGACELAFIGLVPQLAGQGHGRWLLAEALRLAWAGTSVTRVHVHTCTLDHPAALAAYRSVGFIPYSRAIERFPDPRLLGILPLDCAPQVPLFGAPSPPAT